MKHYSKFVLLAAMLASPVLGTTVSFDLDCVLNGLASQGVCTTIPSYGSILLVDTAPNEVTVSVDLFDDEEDLKFRNMMLNFTPLNSGVTGILSADGQVILIADGFSISPYHALFDVGGMPKELGGSDKGWHGDSGYTTVLSGVGGTLTVQNFLAADSFSNLYAALHIQSIGPGNCEGKDDGTTTCAPGAPGEGSLKIGAIAIPVTPEIGEVPEPSTLAMLGAGLAAVVLLRRRHVPA